MTNSLPCPMPALNAVTVPPCSSTSARTNASPMPNPPPGILECRRHLFEHAEDAWQVFRGDADAAVAHRDDGFAAFAATTEADPAGRRRVLDGVVQEIEDRLDDACHVRVQENTRLGQRDDEFVPGGLSRSGGGLQRGFHRRGQVHAPAAQGELSLGFESGQILAVNEVVEPSPRSGESAFLEAQEFLEFAAPPDRLGDEVARPDSHLRTAHGQAEHVAALLQCAFCLDSLLEGRLAARRASRSSRSYWWRSCTTKNASSSKCASP